MKVLRGSGWDTSRTINFILGRTTYIETFLGSFKSGRVKVHISPSLSRHAVDVKVKKENEVVELEIKHGGVTKTISVKLCRII